MRALLGGVVVMALMSGAVLVGVVVTELSYVSDHPYAYGPAKVIAWGAGAGTLLSASIVALSIGLLRSSER